MGVSGVALVDFSPQWARGTSPRSDPPLSTDCPSPLLELDLGRGCLGVARSARVFVRLCSCPLLSSVPHFLARILPREQKHAGGPAPGPGE